MSETGYKYAEIDFLGFSDIFEKISETVKKENLQANQDTIQVSEWVYEPYSITKNCFECAYQDQLEPSDRISLAVKQLPLFDVGEIYSKGKLHTIFLNSHNG